MAINTNIGPERVEVTPKPIGTVLVQGTSTARTAVLISTTKSDAPLNTPSSVFSLSEFEQLFGTESQVGEAYLSVRGFFQNGGEGSELVIVAVKPSSVSGEILEAAELEAPRAIVGSSGQLVDDGEIVVSAIISAYEASSGQVTLDISGIIGDFSKAKTGDLLRDAEGRIFQISNIKDGSVGTEKIVTIDANLDRELQKSAQSLSADGQSVQIIRLFSSAQFDGKLMVQEGDTYGSGVTVTVSDLTVTLINFDAFLNDVRSGDIIVDSSSEEYIITDIVDGDNVLVDRSGMTAGAVDIKRGLKEQVVSTSSTAGSDFKTLSVAPYEAEAGIVRFELATSSDLPPAGSLAGYRIGFDDGSEEEISSNSIIAASTVITGPLAGTISYVASTGIVTAVGETFQTDGALSGDVLIDSNGREYVIQEVVSETELRILKNLASPSSLAGARVNKGAMELSLVSSADFSDKVAGESGEDITGSLQYQANLFLFASSSTLKSDDYFLVEPDFSSADYIGSESDFSGLRALDAVDVVNLVAIPGIYDPAVQGSLIDYCSVTRSDCMALVSIPEFVSSASADQIVVSNLSISGVQESANGSIVSLIGSPDLSGVQTYDLLKIGSKDFVVKAASDEDSKIVVFETTGIPTVGAVSVQRPSAISWKDVIVNKPTEKAAWYYNHVRVLDGSSVEKIVDPVLHVAGIMARIDSNIAQGGVSHAPAGINLAQIAGITGLQLEISERVDGGPLRLAFINRITSSAGNGQYVFGGYTAAGTSATPDEQLVQVIRSILFVKSSLERGLIGFIWENNSPVQRQNIENAILSFLRANAYLFPAGSPEAEQFRVISVTPTEESLAQGLVEVRVQVRFNTAIRFISIDLEFPLPLADQ